MSTRSAPAPLSPIGVVQSGLTDTDAIQGGAGPAQSRITVYGVGPIPDPPADAPPDQWLDFAVVHAMLLGSDLSDTPVKEVARAYLAKWPAPAEQP